MRSHSYEGKLRVDGNSITGSWTQGKVWTLNFQRATKETAWVIDPSPHSVQFVEVKTSQEHHYESSKVSYPDFFDWRTQNHSFERLLSYHDTSYTLTGVDRPSRLDGEVVSWEMVPTLGVSPELGRGFLPEDEKRGSHVILINHSLWRSQFAGNESVLGRTLHLGGKSFTIIGVMPARFRFPITEPTNSFRTTLADDDDPTDVHYRAPIRFRSMLP